MRALILVAGAALAVSACSSNDAADNTMNVDTIEADNIVIDNTLDANLDANMTMNATDMNAMDVNADMNADMTTNNSM